MQVSTLDSRQKRFMWIHKEVDLTPQDQALGFESLDPFLSFFFHKSANRVHVSLPHRRTGVTRDL